MAIATIAVKPKPKLTYEDYASLPDDERCELINGELIPMPSPNWLHQILQAKIFLPLAGFVYGESLGDVVAAPMDILFTPFDVVQPDLIFISNARAHVITEANIRGAPDLLVEILSTSTERRDRIVKRDLYAHHGVSEYWLVDPHAKTITILLLGADGYDTFAVYGEGDTLTSPTLAGFSLNMSELF